jgi:hypothetical protein
MPGAIHDPERGIVQPGGEFVCRDQRTFGHDQT